MALPPLIITKSDGTQIDHLGLACFDLDEGIRWFREKTGVEPVVNPVLPSLPFRNACVRIGELSFLELLGPNPSYKGLHPLKSLLKRFSEPTLWFWYVSTHDFDELEAAINEKGFCVERKMEERAEGDTGPAFVGASIGPGFWPVRPNVIQWKRDSQKHSWIKMPIVPIRDFSVLVCGQQQFESTKAFFESLGIQSSCLNNSDDGDSYLSLTLETPEKGLVTFKSQVESLGTWTVLKTVLKDLVGCL